MRPRGRAVMPWAVVGGPHGCRPRSRRRAPLSLSPPLLLPFSSSLFSPFQPTLPQKHLSMDNSTPLFDILPPELIHLIHSFAIPPLPSQIQCDKCTTRITIAHQDAILRLRLVSPLWAQLVGPPTTFACRNITKVVQLTRALVESPQRGNHVRKVVLHLREPSHGRRRTCILGATLRSLFAMCPNLTEVIAGGVRMDHPDPTWNIWKGGPRMLRVEALLDAASVCSKLECITLLGRNTAVGANFMVK